MLNNLFKTQDGGWLTWMDKVAAQREALARAEDELIATEQEQAALTTKVRFVTKEINARLALNIHSQKPSKAEREKVLLALQALQSKHKGLEYRDHRELWAKQEAELTETESKLAAAQAKAAALTESTATMKQELAELEAQHPKADDKALAALAAAVTSIENEQARVRAALEASASDKDGDAIEDELEAAQARLDELAALAALGQDTGEDQKAAQVELSKAKTKAEKQLKQEEQKAAARRGLEKKLIELEGKAGEAGKIRDQVARLVYGRHLEDTERRLVDYVLSDELKQIMADLRETQDKLNACSPGSNYTHGKRELRIELPALSLHPNRGELSGQAPKL